MDRIIKFRGKRTSDGLWIYGSLISWPDETTQIICFESDESASKCSVMPETVGQFIGWIDSDGAEIYTGDQLELFWKNGRSTCVTISYSNEYGYVMFGNNPVCELVESNVKYKVVGNIHDLLNPAQGNGPLNTMQNFDPKEGQAEQNAVVEAEAQNAQESASQDQAMEATQDSEEGTTEG